MIKKLTPPAPAKPGGATKNSPYRGILLYEPRHTECQLWRAPEAGLFRWCLGHMLVVYSPVMTRYSTIGGFGGLLQMLRTGRLIIRHQKGLLETSYGLISEHLQTDTVRKWRFSAGTQLEYDTWWQQRYHIRSASGARDRLLSSISMTFFTCRLSMLKRRIFNNWGRQLPGSNLNATVLKYNQWDIAQASVNSYSMNA